MLRVARKKAVCRVLGPGDRAVIWFYGCSRRCTGCIAETMGTSEEFEPYSPQELASWVFSHDGIEGITLSGGEPFEQPTELLRQFLEIVKSQSSLSVLCYTGNCYEQLLDNEQYNTIWQHIDVLIDGEYRIDEDAGQRWRGSANQRFHFLTPRYAMEKDEWLLATNREIEIELDLDGSLLLSGVPSREFIDHLTKRLRAEDVFINFS